MTMRVQIPAYTDRWIMGDRYGEVLRIYPVAIVAGRMTSATSLGSSSIRVARSSA